MSANTKAYVISLTRAEERRARFSSLAAEANTPWAFFDAHTGPSSDLHYSDTDAIAQHGRALNPGELGCYSSHMGVWRAFLETGDDQCVVLEDDVLVDWAGIEMVTAIDLAADGIDYLRLYHKRPSRRKVLRTDFARRSLHVIQLFDKVFGTQGYIITRNAAETFVDRFTDVVRPIDDQLDRYYEHGISNLTIFPFLVLEESVPSDIGDARFQGEGDHAAALLLRREDKRQRDRAFVRSKMNSAKNRILGKLGYN